MPNPHKKQMMLSTFVILTCISFFTVFVGPAVATGAPITGTVWLDINGDGQQSAPGFIDDVGHGGVYVYAYDASGGSASAITDVNGDYSISVASLDSGPFRVEMVVPSGYSSAPMGSATETTVRQSIVSGSTDIDFAIEDSTTYCSSNPRIAVSCFANGNGQSVGSAGWATSGKPSIKSFTFNDEGYPGKPGYVAPSTINTQAQTGAIYGLGYSRTTGYLYEGAFLRRHVGLGPGGTGAIYEVNPDTGTVVRTLTVPSSGTAPTGRDLGANTNTSSRDINAFAAVGKVALGDVDVIGEGKTLFTTNLNTRELVRVDSLDTTSPIYSSYAVPGSVVCPGGAADRMIFGLGSRVVAGLDKVYVGVTCNGETGRVAANLVGKVIQFDVASNTFESEVLSFPLNYGKGCALVNSVFGNLGCSWNGWSNNYGNAHSVQLVNEWYVASPQPLISDIQFDQSGAMVIGVADRGGWQWGHDNLPPMASVLFFGSPNMLHRSNQKHTAFAAGDQLRACPDGSGGFNLENNATCGSTSTAGASNNQGPGGGEFYWGDAISRTEGASTLGHQELGLGAFAFVPGRTTMVSTITDPFFTLDGVHDFRSNSVGIAKLAHVTDPATSQTAGGWVGSLELGIYGEGTNDFSKAGGLGDLEVLCENAPLEIGNFVWLDADQNGIQDPGEEPLGGVTVTLKDPGTEAVLATAITDTSGRYLFASEGVGNVVANSWDGPNPGDDDGTDAYGIVADPDANLNNGVYGLTKATNYKLEFDPSTTTLTPALNTLGLTNVSQLALTAVNNDGTTRGDLRDSDATKVSGVNQISILTGSNADNNHSFDAGFYAVPIEVPTTTTTTTQPGQPTTSGPDGPGTSVPQTTPANVEGASLTSVFALPFTGSRTVDVVYLALILTGIGIFLTLRFRKVNRVN